MSAALRVVEINALHLQFHRRNNFCQYPVTLRVAVLGARSFAIEWYPFYVA